MQNDIPATENSITMGIEPPLPRFEDNKPVMTPGGPGGPRPGGTPGYKMPNAAAAGGINADDLPDLDNLDFSAPNP